MIYTFTPLVLVGFIWIGISFTGGITFLDWLNVGSPLIFSYSSPFLVFAIILISLGVCFVVEFGSYYQQLFYPSAIDVLRELEYMEGGVNEKGSNNSDLTVELRGSVNEV